MPKKTYKLLRFEGGLNNNSSPKDVAENQLVALENAAVDEVGRIVSLGSVSEVKATLTGQPTITGGAGKGGRGFVVMTTDNDKFSVNPTAASGAVTAGGAEKRYYLAENDSGFFIKDADAVEPETDYTATAPAELEIYWHDGALRIIDAASTSPAVPMWRGFIPGQLYGNNETGVDDKVYQGHIHNSGETLIDQWYTTTQGIEGCFPTVPLTGTIDMQVGENLIMNHEKLYTGGCEDFNTAAEPFPGAAFANELSAIGEGAAVDPPGNMSTRSGMYWGHALTFQEFENQSGGWAPTGNETYQFYCTTVYDGVQESLPQLFTMYPSGRDFEGTINQDPAHANMTLKNQNPLRYITFTDGEIDSDQFWTNIGNKGVMVKLLLNPIIKFNGLQRDFNATPASLSTYASRNPEYNFGAATAQATNGGNPRITGIRAYWASSEDGYVDLWQLYDWDFRKGVKSIGSDTGGGGYNRVDWTHIGPQGYFVGGSGGTVHTWPNDGVGGQKAPFLYQHTHGRNNSGHGFMFTNPPRYLRYDAINGHSKDETISLQGFKTSATINSRIYAGNVVVDGKRYSDRIVKSGYCLDGPTPDKFPVKSNNIDVAIQDGDEIIKLIEFADRIFQFKKNLLYIINASGASEFLEQKYVFKGIPNAGAVTRTDFGIAWANKSGCYLHNGKTLENLLETKNLRVISPATWGTFVGAGTYLRVGFNPEKRQIIVKGGGDVTTAYLYDIVTKSWTYSTGMVQDGNTGSGFTNDPLDGTLLMASNQETDIKGWQEATGDQAVVITTREIDFGEPAVRKNISKVYVSYKKGHASLAIQYGVNGGAIDQNFDGNLTSTSADFVEAELKPDGTSTKSVKSFQISITGTCDAAFVLNDISIIYRTKSVK